MAKQKNGNQTQPLAAEPRLLTERELSQMLGLSLNTLRHWRVRRVGPAFLKFGRKRQGAVRYNLADVVQWAQAFRVSTRPEVEHANRG